MLALVMGFGAPTQCEARGINPFEYLTDVLFLAYTIIRQAGVD
jgi:hypothetical protein